MPSAPSPYFPLPPYGYGFVGNAGPNFGLRNQSSNFGFNNGSRRPNGYIFKGSNSSKNNSGYKGRNFNYGGFRQTLNNAG